MLSHGLFFFFFQAEDGIRDRDVTGVQTCALPIFVNGRLDSISQPDGICFQPWRRRPLRVMNEDGARPVSLLGEPRSSRLSILWTCVTGYSVIVILRVPGMVVFCVPGMTSSSVGTVRSARKSVLGSTVTRSIPRCLSRAGVAT